MAILRISKQNRTDSPALFALIFVRFRPAIIYTLTLRNYTIYQYTAPIWRYEALTEMTHKRNDVQRNRDVGASRVLPQRLSGRHLAHFAVERAVTYLFWFWVHQNPNQIRTLSSTNQSNPTAEDKIEQFAKSNSGWHEVVDLANATGYSKGHVRSTAKQMASAYSSMEKRKNSQKRVIGYEINGELVVPGGNRAVLEDIIRTHATNVPSNLSQMAVKQMQKFIRKRIATSVVPLGAKLEFRWT